MKILLHLLSKLFNKTGKKVHDCGDEMVVSGSGGSGLMTSRQTGAVFTATSSGGRLQSATDK